MVIERFVRGPQPVYERLAERGRMMPPGLEYVDSWIDERLDRCLQLMETDDPSLFDTWTAAWSDLVRFEIIPLVSSGQAAERALSSEAAL